MRKNEGITLIALIITIIVMLILVAVTINMAVNEGLFGYAGNAARETKVEKQKEENWTNLEDNMSTDDLIEKYSKSESITDLTGTTWRFNNHITYNNGFRFTINGSVFDTTRRYDCTGILTVEESGYYVLCWSLVNENHPYENNSAFAFIPQNELGFPPGWVWGSFATYSVSPCSSPSMTIAGGTDATNPDFITWLQTNAEQIN